MEFDEIGGGYAEDSGGLLKNRPLVLAVSGIIALLFIAALVVLLIQTGPKKAKGPKAAPFTADSPIMVPDAPNVEKDYYQYRTTPERWSREDLEKWFTYPDDKIMKQLEKVNDSLAEEITGVAP